MNAIKPLAETPETVTLSRADFEALLDALEDAQDAAAFRAFEARIAAKGKEAVLADCLPIDLVDRLLAGESPVRVWRTHRGLTLPDLAARASMPASCLSAIETGQQPGSLAAMLRLARVLDLRVEDLVAGDETTGC
ncbi:helix-turn-helix domain-containing protein [Paracraurococcus lichenis]|uniref:Helix-turn-helix transcriptional regulator n=1 Tax=Paracraurococcus lichenis TaxID=3064888 RepID=A0ABT9E8F9_9PROT|nr:helix-turn-helix transcriptional regulator [Paracraurococcus sp. LOR1-02]MDO9712464.1 helix-turn-helix transcriptional regulator [Paracraurococcus sp. LOR1-02]